MPQLKYDSTRTIIAVFLAITLYFFVFPVFWPSPGVSVDLPDLLVPGEDLPVHVAVSAWHPNFTVRQVSFSVDGIGSSAYSSRKLFVPLNLYEAEREKEWSVGFRERASWPQKKRLELTVPTGRMYRSGTLQEGELAGMIDVIIDYTRVTMRSGYPALNVRHSIPFTVTIRS